MFDLEKHHKFLKILGAIGMTAAALGVLLTAVSGWVIWKWVRCMDTVQKSLPTIKKASALYIERHEKELDDEYCTDDGDCIPF